MDETIFALSSAPGRAGVAVIRASGPGAGDALRALTGRALPAARRASLRRLSDPEGGEEIDRALVLWLPGPGTVTGEDMAEFHVHGGRAVVAAMIDALGRLPSLRLAEPGEFTRRAFANGRMDLTQVEGLADLIDAETAAQRRLALAQAEGALEARCTAWRDRLVRALALIEAEIDFSDEELPEGLGDEAAATIGAVRVEMDAAAAGAHRGELLRDGVQVAILGRPNVGKSSLLNRLARREAAIVSDVSGTTRDVIEVRLDLGGVPVVVADTAGLRETEDPVEREGIARASARAAAADIAVWVADLSAGGLEPAWPDGLMASHRVVVGNKADLAGAVPEGIVGVSAVTGEGLAGLEAWLSDSAAELAGAGGEPALVSRARQAACLRDASAALARAGSQGEAALAAEDVRLALRALGRLVGKTDVEDVLDVIFRDFCIGK